MAIATGEFEHALMVAGTVPETGVPEQATAEPL
jgi:hypothetical protein